MRLAIIFVAVLALALCAVAQTDEPPKEPAKASLEGTVVKDPGGEPIKKAILEMIAENQMGGGNYTATSDGEGRFKIADILPGRYRMLVERTGYIEVDKKGRRSQGSMLSFEAGQETQGSDASHARGCSRDGPGYGRRWRSDGERRRDGAAPQGKVAWSPMGQPQTNDLGEYRIGGLLAGKYYVSAQPLPNFQTFAMLGKSAEGREAAASRTSYLRTFYPGVLDRAQASTIELHSGEETPVDFSLSRRHAASVRGRVLGLPQEPGGTVIAAQQRSQSMNSTAEKLTRTGNSRF